MLLHHAFELYLNKVDFVAKYYTMVYYCGHCDFKSIRVDSLQMHMETGCNVVEGKKEKEETQKLVKGCMYALYKLLQRIK